MKEQLITAFHGQGKSRVISNTWDNNFIGINKSGSIIHIRRDIPGTKRIWSLDCQ